MEDPARLLLASSRGDGADVGKTGVVKVGTAKAAAGMCCRQSQKQSVLAQKSASTPWSAADGSGASRSWQLVVAGVGS